MEIIHQYPEKNIHECREIFIPAIDAEFRWGIETPANKLTKFAPI